MYLILGLGRTGLAVANYFLTKNINFVFNDDSKSHLSKVLQEKFVASASEIVGKNIEALILSPGISSKYNVVNSFVIYAKENGIPIISDIELFQKFYPEKIYIGVTGTNGKSTTSTLVYEILKNAGKSVVLCGNIGTSPFANAIDAEICVIEISSFQLEITNAKFEIGAIINITPDHLDRYPTTEYYAKEKLKIINLAKKTIVNANLNCKDANVITCSHEELADYEIMNNEITFKHNVVCKFPKMKLIGNHNKQNVLFGFAVCHQLRIEKDVIINTIENFNAIEHRIEFVDNIENVSFYNDSKATNIDSTLNALQAISGPTFLIAGGKLVENISNLFENSAFKHVKMVALIGSAAGVIAKALQEHNNRNINRQIKYCLSGNIEKAIEDLYFHAKKVENSTILLSPFCKSFDQFSSFEERGKLFKEYITNLIIKQNAKTQ